MGAERKKTVTIAVSLTIGALALALAGCGGGSSGGATTSTPPTTAAGGGNAEAGAAAWEQANCDGCHTLEAAGSTGGVGPNLDDLKPDSDSRHAGDERRRRDARIRRQATAQQIDDVAAYVVRSTRG